MIVKLTAEQISEHWPVIKYAIVRALPPIAKGGPDRINNVLTALLSDAMQCWVSYERSHEGGLQIDVVMTTLMSVDPASKVKNLLVYSMFGYKSASVDNWLAGVHHVAKWAKAEGCHRIIGYTDVDPLIKRIVELGGEAQYTLVTLDLEDLV